MVIDSAHIASAFDRDLEAIQALIMKMGGMVEEQIVDAARSLAERDEELAETMTKFGALLGAIDR